MNLENVNELKINVVGEFDYVSKYVSENFPSDQYAIRSVKRNGGLMITSYDVEITKRRAGLII